LVYCCFSFMGRGVIEASPLTVWEAVKNPLSRYIYDNMLKVLKLSELIDKLTCLSPPLVVAVRVSCSLARERLLPTMFCN